MSQHDLTIANQGFPAFRADLNSALQALGSCQSGTSAPSPTFANQLWYDTTNNILKIRNEDNDAWISLLTLDQVADAVSAIGSISLSSISDVIANAVTLAGSQTLTNKTLTNPVINGFTGNTAVVNIGSGQFYKDTGGNIGVGTNSPSTYAKLSVYDGDLAIVKLHGASSYPTLVLQNATAGTTFSGRVLWKDGNGNNGWNIGQNIIQGSGYLEFNNNTTSSGYFDSSNNFAFNSGYGSAKIAYGCRAWVNFNGTNGTIRASGNVSSVTYNATGDYTVNFATAMVDANYCPVFGGAMDWRTIGSSGTSDITTSYCRLYVRIPSNANPSNVDTVTLAIFR